MSIVYPKLTAYSSASAFLAGYSSGDNIFFSSLYVLNVLPGFSKLYKELNSDKVSSVISLYFSPFFPFLNLTGLPVFESLRVIKFLDGSNPENGPGPTTLTCPAPIYVVGGVTFLN